MQSYSIKIYLPFILLIVFAQVNAQNPNRPQTPKEPFNYNIEEVEYDNADKTIHYGATLTIPKNLKKFPIAIIISGSGSQDRNGTLLGHQPYWVLADYLSNNGVAVLRVDDRGTGKTTKGANPKKITSLDLSFDVENSLNYLLQRKDIKQNEIGLIGHSEGGIIAPMVAARRKEIKYLVLWGAPVIGGAITNTNQNLLALRKAGIDSNATVAFGKLHLSILENFAENDTALFKLKIDSTYKQWTRQQDPKILKALYANEQFIVGQNVNAMYKQLYDINWMRYFINYNSKVDLEQVKCRVLAMIGEKDTQVDADTNLALTEAILKESGNKRVVIKKMASLNHLFQTATTGDVLEYQKIAETMAPIALSLIANWINKK
jgi:alpha-beta hydrolase superfamily lysophospholipase